MKTRLVLTLLAAILGLATLGTSHARAQASLTFGGGLGKPLTLTLNAPVTYVITTAAASGSGPIFNFQGVGNVLGNGFGANGTITFTINGGAAQTLNVLGSGHVGGNVVATDFYLYNSSSQPGVAVGNTVVLRAGTLTTGVNFAGAPPASGSYPTFVADGNGNRLDAVNGVSVPEPSAWALLALGSGALGLTLRRQRRSAAAARV